MYFIKMSDGVRTQCELASHAKEKFKKNPKSSNTKKKNRKLTVVNECLLLKGVDRVLNQFNPNQ